MRFETATAYILGVALPLLEVCRRRTHVDNIPAYVDDFIIGALLLWGAYSVTHQKRYGPSLLIAAWGVLCGGLWFSVFGQLQNPNPADISGLPNVTVLLIKLAVYGIAITSLTLAIRRSSREG
jgi:hypothetical protein